MGRRRCRTSKLIRITKAITTIPPTDAATIMSVVVLPEDVDEEAPSAGFAVEVGSPKSDDVLLLLGKEKVAVEEPSIAPGVGSGRSRKQDVCVRH